VLVHLEKIPIPTCIIPYFDKKSAFLLSIYYQLVNLIFRALVTEIFGFFNLY